MTDRSLTSYAVWDRPTRLFHWVNFVTVVALATVGTAILYAKELGVTNDGKILLKTVHVWFGYVFVINLLWRVIWAFIGNRYARWRSLLPFGPGFGQALSAYRDGLGRADGPRYLGHNPIGRMMVAVLLLLLIAQAVTGIVLAGTDIYYPPLGSWIANWVAAAGVDPASLVPYDKTGIDEAAWEAMRGFRTPFISVHYWVFYGLLAAVVVHIVGVLVTELREGGAIVSAMFTGHKTFDHPPVDAD